MRSLDQIDAMMQQISLKQLEAKETETLEDDKLMAMAFNTLSWVLGVDHTPIEQLDNPR